jgi:broad specificity phosphatase PhoE
MPEPDRLRELAEATEPRLQLVAPFFLLPGPDVTEVLLIRHAQIPEGTLGGETALTDVGREQAQTLAAYLESPPLAAVYSSPADRARATAEIVAAPQGLEVGVLEGVRDVDSNLPHGLEPREALVQTYGEAEGARRYDAMVNGGWSFDLFGGELLEGSASLRSRVAAAVDEVVSRHPGQRVVVVTHGPSIAAYVGQIMQSPADFAFYPRLTSITSVLAQGERRQVHLLNAMPHFGVL